MAVDFPSNPNTGDFYQNPATEAYYQYDGESWRVVCFDVQLSCEPEGTWENQGEQPNNVVPSTGFYWRIIALDDTTVNEVPGSTKLMLGAPSYLPDLGGGPAKIILNGTPFLVLKYGTVSGFTNSVYLYGDQSAFLNDPANSTVDYKFCDGSDFVTLDYFTADQKRQDDAITELEEEFENLLPSLDRGSWRYNEDFTKPPGKFGFRTDGGGLPTTFADVARIILNAEDDAGEPHGFGDIKVDSYIQLFQDGENDTAIYHVDELPAASGDEFTIEVSFVRAEGDYPELDELFRFKFYEIVGGDAGAYVLKTGDTMSGKLEFAIDDSTDPYGSIYASSRSAINIEGVREINSNYKIEFNAPDSFTFYSEKSSPYNVFGVVTPGCITSPDSTSNFYKFLVDGKGTIWAGHNAANAFVATEDHHVATKKYVDQNSGGVEVRAGAPDAPIPLGKMWFDTTRNALYLKTGS
jgi:hypothetical protein